MRSTTARSKRKLLILLSLAISGSLVTGARDDHDPVVSPPVPAVEVPSQIAPIPADLMQDVLSIVQREYLRPVTAEQLDRIARERTLEALDPYSNYLDAAAYELFKLDLASAYGGIGVRLQPNPEEAGFRVLGPMLGSPAHKAGIVAGELITAVDGRTLRGASLDQAIEWLMGKPGTSVALSLQDGPAGTRRELTIERAVIAIPTVRGVALDRQGAWRYRLDDRGVAYLRITAFAKSTAAEFANAISAIEADRATSLIIDLRGNQGGLINAAIEIGDLMIDKGRIVSYRSKDGEEVRDATPGARPPIPIAVLVDGKTTSSAEVLAAALQDHGRATIVGTRTFGKGTTQKLFPLPRGGGAIRLTIAEWLRPSGLSIDRRGASEVERGGVSPAEKAALEASEDSWTKWRTALLASDENMTLVLDPPAPSPLSNDPVLERALSLLDENRRAAELQDPVAWSIGKWRGVRRAAADRSEASITVRVESLPGAPGQVECLRVESEKGPYTGFTVRMLDRDTGRWVMLYTNSPERGVARLVAEFDGDRSSWTSITAGPGRESRFISERVDRDRWRRTQLVSDDDGKTWAVLFVDELERERTDR